MTGGFPDENRWPFIGRDRDLEKCLAFLKPGDAPVPSRLLMIAGESGSGKSFFAKELICRFTERTPSAIGLYINVEESEFESTQLERRLALLASYPAQPTRTDPQHVPVNAGLARYRRPLPAGLRALRHVYGGLREATEAVPLFGKAIKALLPRTLPQSKRRELATPGRFWDYIIATAARDPVLLVIDNFQSLPDSLAVEVDAALAVADTGFRLVLVERVIEGVAVAPRPRCFGDQRLSLRMSVLSSEETFDIVRAVLGEATRGYPS